MTSASCGLYSVQSIPEAGRGVIATQTIPKETQLLRSRPPAAHVLQWEYRKETCSQCFYYNLGRALPVRLSSAGKVFCTAECQLTWQEAQGQVGVTAWERLHAFVTVKGKAISSAHSLPLLCEKPGRDEIASAWDRAAGIVEQVTMSSVSTGHRKKKSKPPTVPTDVVDPYILCYLLSGILFHHHHRQDWQNITSLAMDDSPYQSTRDLEAHCTSFIQLASIAPTQLQPSLTGDVCQTLISAASHNAFGIRFGSDGEEYMGYAVYPEASYFNHSCSPNIAKIRKGDRWEFTARGEIAEGEECCITYLGGDEETMSVEARRARLKLHWGFECMCLRCKEESQDQMSS